MIFSTIREFWTNAGTLKTKVMVGSVISLFIISAIVLSMIFSRMSSCRIRSLEKKARNENDIQEDLKDQRNEIITDGRKLNDQIEYDKKRSNSNIHRQKKKVREAVGSRNGRDVTAQELESEIDRDLKR